MKKVCRALSAVRLGLLVLSIMLRTVGTRNVVRVAVGGFPRKEKLEP